MNASPVVSQFVEIDAASFRADTGRRLISGLLLRWNTPARSGGEWWVFEPGSLEWTATSRVKLNRNHDRDATLGVAKALTTTRDGLEGTFQIARGPQGDELLALAVDGVLDGFSVEVTFEQAGDLEEVPYPQVRGGRVQLVHRGTLNGVALTGQPAFDDARVSSVAASRDQRIDLRLDADELAGVRAAADAAGVSMNDVIRSALGRHYVTQRPVYGLDGSTAASLVRDSWVDRHPSDGNAFEARDRLDAHRRFMRHLEAQFATVTTGNAGQVIPPGYLPLLAEYEADRPLFAAASKGEIDNAAAFVVPGDLSEASVASGAATHVEGTNPTDGSIALTPRTVAPTGISGLFRCTREIVDSSNPAIDGIAFTVMREDWNRQAETNIYTELNTVQAGSITGDTVPSGAMARTSAGSALPSDLRKALALFGEYRKIRPRSVVGSTRKSVSEALETLDSSTVPAGSEDMWIVNGCGVRLSPFITGTAAGDGDVFILGRGDLWAWFSPLLEFQYYERGGPAFVDLAVYGYFATRLIKPIGLASVRHT